MKKALGLLILGVGAGALWLFRSDPPAPTVPPDPPARDAKAPRLQQGTENSIDSGNTSVAAQTEETPVGGTPTAGNPASPDGLPDYVQVVAPVVSEGNRLHQPGSTPADDLDILQVLLEYGFRAYKTMPAVGLNEEYVAYLIGKNPKGIQMLAHDHPAISKKGELLDRWGTPYFFHPVSERQVDIVSAGPDGKLFTEDDISLK